MPCRGFTEVLLFRTGVLAPCTVPIEVELVVLLNGVGEGFCAPAGVAFLLVTEGDTGCTTTREDSGNAVSDAVPSESRSRVAESDAPLLFVDLNGGGEGVADSVDDSGIASIPISLLSNKALFPSDCW